MDQNGYVSTPVHPIRRRYDSEQTDPVQSEISMSVVTDDTRMIMNRRRSTLYALTKNQGFCKCFSINIEPVLFLMTCGFALTLTSSSLFIYWARCVQIAQADKSIGENATLACASISADNSTIQDKVEKDISTTKIYLQIVSCIPTLIVSPIMGSWSDRNGRKTPLLMGLFGMVVNNVLQLCATLTYDSINIYYWFFASEICLGCFGGVAATFSNALAMVTDEVRHKLKPGSSTVPFRIGLASVIQSVGSILGSFLVTFLTVPALISIEDHEFSYVKLCFIQTGVAIISVIYTIFFVRETHFPNREDFNYNRFDDVEEILDTDPVELQKPLLFRRFSKYITSIFGILTVRRPGWTRLCLCSSLLFIFVEFLSFDPSLLLLLVKRLPFAWSDKVYSYYTLIRGLSTTLGMIICPLLLTLCHWLGKDSLLIIAALFSTAIISFMTAFATTTNELFYTCIFGLILGGLQPAYRSFLPRMVAKEETARLLTAVSIITAFSPIISSLIFNNIFNLTLDWWAGFAFFLTGIFQTIIFLGQIVVHLLMRPQWKLDKQLRARRENETDSHEEIPNDFSSTLVPDAEQRSISNTAVDSDSGSRREL